MFLILGTKLFVFSLNVCSVNESISFIFTYCSLKNSNWNHVCYIIVVQFSLFQASDWSGYNGYGSSVGYGYGGTGYGYGGNSGYGHDGGHYLSGYGYNKGYGSVGSGYNKGYGGYGDVGYGYGSAAGYNNGYGYNKKA